MRSLEERFEANRNWAARMREQDPNFFEDLVISSVRICSGLVARTAGSRQTASSASSPARYSSTATWATSWCTPTSNCLRVLQYGVEVLGV
jgi:carbonic anhydrase